MQAGDFIDASHILDSQTESHSYPCYGGNGIRGYVDVYNHQGARLIIGRQGARCGNVQRVTGKFYATEHAVVTSSRDPHTDVNWAFHALTAMDLNQFATKSAQPGLAVSTLARVPIALPPVAEQTRVASILDALDRLVNDLSFGLPAEISARRLQYKYYRDRLLAFSEAA